MKVEEMRVMDYAGLQKQHDYKLGKINVLCAGNGQGKTSFLSAFRYALTGAESTEEIVSSGAEKAYVQLCLSNGQKYTRMKSKKQGEPSKCYIDKEKVTQKQLNENISAELGGVSLANAKVISSAEVLQNLSSQKFGELLLSYLPEQVTTDVLLERMEDLSEKEEAIVREILPEGSFGLSEINAAYKTLYDRRKQIKERITKASALVNQFSNLQEIEVSPALLEKEKKALQEKRDEILKRQYAKKAHEKAKEERQRQERSKKEIQEEIEKIRIVGLTEEEKKRLEEEKADLSTCLLTLNSSLETSKQTKKMLQKAYETLSQPVCPLSEKLVCTTDKSQIKKELEDNIAATESNISSCEKNLRQVKEKQAKLDEKLIEVRRDLENQKRKAMLEKSLLHLAQNMPKLQEETKGEISMKECDEKLLALEQKLFSAKNYQALESQRKLLKKCEALLPSYEALTFAFSPKGSVKEAIISYYLDAFSDPLSEKANKIFPGMQIQFRSKNGVVLFADPKGDGYFLPFSALSGGEKACVLFVLMSMLSSLCGIRVLLMDELSVFDEAAFSRLLDVTSQHQEEYDICILACVNHEGFQKILRDKEINIISP